MPVDYTYIFNKNIMTISSKFIEINKEYKSKLMQKRYDLFMLESENG